MDQPVAQIRNGKTSNIPANDLFKDVKTEDVSTNTNTNTRTCLEASDGGVGEEVTFTWDDDGERNRHGLIEHQRLAMIENGTKTSFQIGDAVLLEPPKGSDAMYVARIDGMWQEAEHPERKGESLMMIRCQWYYRVSIRTAMRSPVVLTMHRHSLTCSYRKNPLSARYQVRILLEKYQRRCL
jgi:hypothetical protein